MFVLIGIIPANKYNSQCRDAIKCSTSAAVLRKWATKNLHEQYEEYATIKLDEIGLLDVADTVHQCCGCPKTASQAFEEKEKTPDGWSSVRRGKTTALYCRNCTDKLIKALDNK
jgi:hypothetical protein